MWISLVLTLQLGPLSLPSTATGKALSQGSLSACNVHSELPNGNYEKDDGEDHVFTDSSGQYNVPYIGQNDIVVVTPTTGCKDQVFQNELEMIIVTRADASIASPLTSVAVMLMDRFGLTKDEASDRIWRSFDIPSQDVWSFDCFTDSHTFFQASWWILHSHIQHTVQSFRKTISTSYDHDVQDDIAVFASIAERVHNYTSLKVDLTDDSTILSYRMLHETNSSVSDDEANLYLEGPQNSQTAEIILSTLSGGTSFPLHPSPPSPPFSFPSFLRSLPLSGHSSALPPSPPPLPLLLPLRSLLRSLLRSFLLPLLLLRSPLHSLLLPLLLSFAVLGYATISLAGT